MPTERYFISKKFSIASKVFLEDQEFHHLRHVMRMIEGESCEVVNGQGELASATLLEIEKKRALLQIDSFTSEPQSSTKVILVQAIPRINRLDFILEKGTELGMDAIWLFPAAHGERKELTEHQLERMQAITISAMKQCGRLYLPMIEIKPPLEKWQKPNGESFFGDVDPNAPLLENAWKKNPEKVLFFIGPESGFSSEEEALLKQWGSGVKLHSHILRTDTAALAALSLVQNALLKGR